MTLNAKLQELKLASRARVHPESAAIMAQAAEELQSSGLLSQALGAGALAPSFDLNDWQGVRYNSAQLLAKGPLILSFYRGSW